jgi:hypothetical protein
MFVSTPPDQGSQVATAINFRVRNVPDVVVEEQHTVENVDLHVEDVLIVGTEVDFVPDEAHAIFGAQGGQKHLVVSV